MKKPRVVCRRALIIGAAAALLAGCGTAPGAMPLDAALTAPSDRSGSWMLPEGKHRDLLYVVDGGTQVDVLTYPGFKLVGTIAGFSESTGLCSDAQGNVWVANDSASELVEYAHGGTTPIATLDDPNQYPISCSVDPKSGSLAVSDFPIASGESSIAVYAHETGTPTLYHDRRIAEILYLGYGPRSRLFFDGTLGNDFAMGRFKGGSFSRISVRGATITSAPGGVQYANGTLTTTAHGSGETALIFRMSDSGRIESTTELLGADVCQGYLIWKTVVICPSGYNDLFVYRYPQGGIALKEVAVRYYAIQAAMSVAAP